MKLSEIPQKEHNKMEIIQFNGGVILNKIPIDSEWTIMDRNDRFCNWMEYKIPKLYQNILAQIIMRLENLLKKLIQL